MKQYKMGASEIASKWSQGIPPVAPAMPATAGVRNIPVSKETYRPELDRTFYRNDGLKHIKSRGM